VLSIKIWVKNHITVGFSAFLCNVGVWQHVTSLNKIIHRALFKESSKWKKFRPIFNEDSPELYWPSFWLHIVNLCKIPFHLIGRTLYLCKELKFSFFESPLQKSNGGSKNENFILKLNHIVWPIEWKGILHRLTIWGQKIGQYNSVESSLKMGLIFFHFEDY